jgi:outer membrane protein assembly factor BamB
LVVAMFAAVRESAATAVPLRNLEILRQLEWPGWRGPQRDNVCTEKGLLTSWPADGPKLLWGVREVNGGRSCGLGFSSLAIADGMIFTMGDRQKEGLVFCYDALTGKERWATLTHPAHGTDGPRSTPAVDGEHVYALSPQGILVCLDRATGNLVWRRDLKQDFGGKMMSGWGHSESPLLDGDKLICAPGAPTAALVALNKSTGEVIWRTPLENCSGAGYSSIVVTDAGGIRQYVTLLGAKEGMVGVEARSGKLLWSYQRIANATANMVTPIVRDDLVFASSGYNVGTALVQLTPTEQRGINTREVYFLPANVLQNMHGSMVLWNGHVYGGHGHNEGKPFCLELSSGRLLWGPQAAVGQGSATVLYADGHLYFRYQNNVMALVEATPLGFALKGKFDLPKELGTPSFQQTIIQYGRMYIRGRDQILCYDIRRP